MSKHRMMKLWRMCIVQKSRLSLHLEVIAPWVCTPQKCGIGLRCLENQHRLSSIYFAIFCCVCVDNKIAHCMASWK